jgi:hypothetical protein
MHQLSELSFDAYPGDHRLLTKELSWGSETQAVEDYVHDCIDAGLVHTIHTSERKAFRSCRQRWQWAYQDDLHTSESVRALEFGQAYHRAMEVFYDPKTWHLDKEVLAVHAIAEFDRFTTETFNRYAKLGLADERLVEDFADRMTSGVAMLQHYFRDIAPLTDTFEPVEVEIAFEVPLLDPDGNYLLCKCERCYVKRFGYGKAEYDLSAAWRGMPVTIGGRLDLLARDLETGELGILDWKTAGTLMKDEEIDFLELDDQISTYLLAMHKLGLPARVFWYHEQWKAAPQAPEPYAGGRRIKGRMYQANKSLSTTYALYYATVSEGDPAGMAAGAYDEYLDWLKTEGPRYYQRVPVRRTDEQLRATERAIYLEYLDMVSDRIYISPERRKCNWCNFFDPCLGKQRGEPYQHALNTMYVKGGPLTTNDSNAPKKAP